jgi:ADP-ribosyl-[dinitrogen reductase] hydrolase
MEKGLRRQNAGDKISEEEKTMAILGAIVGDIEGSHFEWNNAKTKGIDIFSPYCRFTDDTVMTLAVMEICDKKLFGDPKAMAATLRKWGARYPNVGYGGMFRKWLADPKMGPYGSFGNGAAMRISPVGWVASSEEEAAKLSRAVTSITHNDPRGIEGAEVTAMCVYYARIGKSKEFIKNYIAKHYDIGFDYVDLVKNYEFSSTCQGSVPQALFAFLISENYEDFIRTAMAIGGDCDTTGAIGGGVAEAYYGGVEPKLLETFAKTMLAKDAEALELIEGRWAGPGRDGKR